MIAIGVFWISVRFHCSWRHFSLVTVTNLRMDVFFLQPIFLFLDVAFKHASDVYILLPFKYTVSVLKLVTNPEIHFGIS